jgi:uncharacterized protein (DUF58 family)
MDAKPRDTMAATAREPAPDAPIAGVYVSLDDLVRLQYQARRVTFKARQPVHSILTGRHASRVRGRGLDFEEVRAYLPGDDIRSIDWRVTARTGVAHTRVYTEERDRPALILVDQRLAMFFGTRLSLKSVTAAEAAALAAWTVFRSGDRVGAVVFDDAELVALRPHRSRGQVLRILEAIVQKNRALRADTDLKSVPRMLNRALERARSLVGHDHVIVIASDFDGADDHTRRLVTELSQHNDVIAMLVHDPSSQELPERGRVVVTGGELQVQVDVGRAGERNALLALASQRVKPILAWTRELGVPVMPLSTAEEVAAQVSRLLGAAFRRRRA